MDYFVKGIEEGKINMWAQGFESGFNNVVYNRLKL